MKSPAVSVIIPVYNRPELVKRCIESILSQSFSDFELLIVDDGSTDNTAEVCESYAQRDERVRVFRQKNGGGGSAINTGFDAASGEYVTVVDSDDFIDVFFLEKMQKEISAAKTVMCVCGNRAVDENEEIIYIRHVPSKNMTGEDCLENWFSLRFFAFAYYARFFRLDFLRKNNLRFIADPYTRLPGDFYFCSEMFFAIAREKLEVSFLNEALYNSRTHRKSTVHSNQVPSFKSLCAFHEWFAEKTGWRFAARQVFSPMHWFIYCDSSIHKTLRPLLIDFIKKFYAHKKSFFILLMLVPARLAPHKFLKALYRVYFAVCKPGKI